MGTLIATSVGSAANSPKSLSASGHVEQPWLVNNSSSARGPPAFAEAQLASTSTVPKEADAKRQRTVPVLPRRFGARCPAARTLLISAAAFTRHSIRSDLSGPGRSELRLPLSASGG